MVSALKKKAAFWLLFFCILGKGNAACVAYRRGFICFLVFVMLQDEKKYDVKIDQKKRQQEMCSSLAEDCQSALSW
jgi:hypothetical protein